MKFTVRGDASALVAADPEASHGWAAMPVSALQRMSLSGLPFASLGTRMLGSSALDALPTVRERRTGTDFPGEYCLTEGQRSCPIIAGAGARTKRLAGIKNIDIYALALYVDQDAAHSTLHPKFKDASSADSLARDQALFDELVKAESVEKTLSIVITSGLVKRRNFLDALEERLEPALKQAGELPALEAFKSQFDAAHFRKGLEIRFTAKAGKLYTKVDGQQVGAISNPHLTKSLLDIYVGTNPVSQGAKDSFGAGLAGIVLA